VSTLAGAAPVELTGENVSIAIPDDWKTVQKPVDLPPTAAVPIFSAANSENSAALTVMLCANAIQMPVTNPGFVAGVKNSISAGASNKGNSVQFTTEGPITLNGVPAYGIQHGLTLPNTRLVLCHTYLIAGNRKLYLILTQALDPGQVPALEAMATSFRFDTPPEIPVPPIPHRRLKIALVVTAGIVGVALVSGIIYLFMRRRE
jgi:hypothetical protein